MAAASGFPITLRPLGPRQRPRLEAQVLQWLWEEYNAGFFSCPNGHRHASLSIEPLDLPGLPNAYRLGCPVCGFETPLFVVQNGCIQHAGR